MKHYQFLSKDPVVKINVLKTLIFILLTLTSVTSVYASENSLIRIEFEDDGQALLAERHLVSGVSVVSPSDSISKKDVAEVIKTEFSEYEILWKKGNHLVLKLDAKPYTVMKNFKRYTVLKYLGRFTTAKEGQRKIAEFLRTVNLKPFQKIEVFAIRPKIFHEYKSSRPHAIRYTETEMMAKARSEDQNIAHAFRGQFIVFDS